MPQKNNPDVLELLRARAARLLSAAFGVADIVRALPSGYNRDLQETKAPFIHGFDSVRASLRIAALLTDGMTVDKSALKKGFSSSVFATDRALELVAGGMPFRDAYHQVKENLSGLEQADPVAAIAKKTHLGGTAGLNWEMFRRLIRDEKLFATGELRRYHARVSKLMVVNYPF